MTDRPIEEQAREQRLRDGVRDNGTVEGWFVETYYMPCKGVMTDKRIKCLRVIGDDDATDIETRVLFETLEDDGWMPPEEATALRTSHAELVKALEALMLLESRGRVMPIGREWDDARTALSAAKGLE